MTRNCSSGSRFSRWAVIPLVLVFWSGISTASGAQATTYSSAFEIRDIPTNGTTLHVRVGGKGPAVVLLHGYGDTGDMWVPVAEQLVKEYRVVVPDLRGMGLSARADHGFDKKNQAEDIAGILDALNIKQTAVVAHDIGNMVAFAFSAFHSDRVTRLVLMDAPVPGVGPWEEILKNPLLWHFRFGGPDMERLVAGRERIYLDRFWNDFSANPARFSEADRNHYAELYARPGAMHAGFSQFAAFDQDAIDNRAWMAGHRLEMPVLAVGGEKSFGTQMAFIIRFAADDVHQAVIADAGHWLMEEQPAATSALIVQFLHGEAAALPASALSRSAVDGLPRRSGAAGTSGLRGVEITILSGDPAKEGPYTIAIRVPPHTGIEAHTHRDNRVATVVSGDWYFGYGSQADPRQAQLLTPGSFYTEPAGAPHFAFTKDKSAVVYVSGNGPSSTDYLGVTH